MSAREILAHRQKIENIFKKVDTLPKDVEIQSHWAKYLCVLISGYLEKSIRMLYSNYARNTANANVARFVDNNLKSFQNPKMEKILDIARSFNPEWETQLRSATEGELKDAIDSIVSNRHLIAHGLDVGLTIIRIRNYYERASKIVDLIEKLCKGEKVS